MRALSDGNSVRESSFQFFMLSDTEFFAEAHEDCGDLLASCVVLRLQARDSVLFGASGDESLGIRPRECIPRP